MLQSLNHVNFYWIIKTKDFHGLFFKFFLWVQCIHCVVNKIIFKSYNWRIIIIFFFYFPKMLLLTRLLSERDVNIRIVFRILLSVVLFTAVIWVEYKQNYSNNLNLNSNVRDDWYKSFSYCHFLSMVFGNELCIIIVSN